MPILVTYDELKEGCWALSAGKKGASAEVINWCCDTLADSGYGGSDVTVKADQEPAIVSLRKGIAEKPCWRHGAFELSCQMLALKWTDGECGKDISRSFARLEALL